MPYIITTRAYATSSACPRLPAPRIRRAVATLEEARDWCELQPAAVDPSTETPITEAGGTIGPLPDGTVIEVARATLPELACAAAVPLPDFSQRALDGTPLSTQRIIDAYNAAQDQGTGCHA